MNEDSATNGSGRSWFERLGQALSGEFRDREDIITELKEAHDRGIIDADALPMIEGALRMGDLKVRDVMIPRAQMVVVPHDAAISEILPMVVESGHSRFPVVSDNREEVLGIVLAKDLLRCYCPAGERLGLKDLMRPPVLIPESKRLNVLLREFRDSRNHMAIVVDEYGAVAGLVTIEDVLEEIVGDIDDEYDESEDGAGIVEIAPGRFQIAALTPIEEVNEAFGCRFRDDEYDTIGGLVLAEIGRLPELGEKVRIGSLELTVTAADKRRIHQLQLQRG